MLISEFDTRQEVQGLYQDHHQWLVGWLTKRLGCAYQAADLTQDTFLRILSAQRTQAIEKPRAYLTTVAKGLLINWYQRQALERAWLETLAALPDAQLPSEEQRYLILETLHEIDAMLDALPSRVKQAFLLSQIEGLKYSEIATELGVSMITVKRYMKQAFLQCLLIAE